MNIKYEDLKNFFENIFELYTLTSKFINYFEFLVKSLVGKCIHEIPEELKELVLGGLKPNGVYSENAYALFIRDFIGLKLEDPKLYVAKLRLTKAPDVKIVLEETSFIRFIHILNKVLEFLVNKANELNFSVRKSAIEDKLYVEDLVTKIINTCSALVVGINNVTSTAWSLQKISTYYLKKLYIEIPNQVLEFLGLTKILEIPSSEQYKLYGFPDFFTQCIFAIDDPVNNCALINGIPIEPTMERREYIKKKLGVNPDFFTIEPSTIGGAICMLNEIIWRLFKKIPSKWFNNYVNLEEEYIKKAWESLKNAGWSIPEYLKKPKLYTRYDDIMKCSIYDHSTGPFFHFIGYENGIATKHIYWSHNLGNFNLIENPLEEYFVLPDLFDDLMPAMHLGVIHIALRMQSYDKSIYRNALLISVRTG